MKRVMLAILIVFTASTAYAGLTGLGIGIHGGKISGYDNPVLENSLEQYFLNQVIDFSEDMTNVGLHVNIGTLRVIEFDASADYAWQKNEIIPGTDLKYSDISVTGTVKKSISVGIIKPYAGVGGGLHAMAFTLEQNGAIVGVLPDNETKIGYHFKAGVELNIPIFPITPSLEWKYNVIQTTGESSKYNSINLGLTLDLP